MNLLGIMQGRLSPVPGAKPQTFPNMWEEEFEHASRLGFDSIEWLFTGNPEQNPIWSDEGVEKIIDVSRRSSVRVLSVCAHYFMNKPLFRGRNTECRDRLIVLKRLIEMSSRLGIRTVLMPVMENAELANDDERDRLVMLLSEVLPLAESRGINIGLETDLPSDQFRDLIGLFPKGVGAYYDVGNAAARGYDCSKDLRVLDGFISGIHIKDRRRSGVSVPLGEGDVDFGCFSNVLKEIKYNDLLILETPCGDDPFLSALSNKNFVFSILRD
jgi:L-ribulose-5-phosphate 3-epimerase